jgi:hypothetical protein
MRFVINRRNRIPAQRGGNNFAEVAKDQGFLLMYGRRIS